MRACLTALLLIAATPAALAQSLPPQITAPAGKYTVDLGHASIVWRLRHMGLSNYTARFTKFTSTVDYDPADATRSKLEVTIDANSVRSEYPFPERENFDAKIAKSYLKAGAHPQIRFVSRAIERTADNRGRVTGDLTLGGVTRPVVLDATFNGAISNPFNKKPVFGVSATGRFNRSDFGLGDGVPIIGDTIELQIEAEYVK